MPNDLEHLNEMLEELYFRKAHDTQWIRTLLSIGFFVMQHSNSSGRFISFLADVSAHTPLRKMTLLLIVLWMSFSTGMYLAERGNEGAAIESLGAALYWGIAAFSTAGIANTPVTATGQFIGGVWIVIGSVLFFGTIVATVTTYFMRPMQRPHRMIIETIEYNLEQLDDLTIEEIDLVKDTVDVLIRHVEELKERQQGINPAKTRGLPPQPGP